MSLDDIKKWLREFRERPLNAIFYFVLVIILVTSGIFAHNWINHRSDELLKDRPFKDLEGQYEGEAEGNKFKLCLKVFGNKVRGAMVWDDSPLLIDYVDYEGTIGDTQVDLTYKRNSKHPYPDNGIAIITAPMNGVYGGFWQSSVIPNNRQFWSLKKTSSACSLLNWDG